MKGKILGVAAWRRGTAIRPSFSRSPLDDVHQVLSIRLSFPSTSNDAFPAFNGSDEQRNVDAMMDAAQRHGVRRRPGALQRRPAAEGRRDGEPAKIDKEVG